MKYIILGKEEKVEGQKVFLPRFGVFDNLKAAMSKAIVLGITSVDVVKVIKDFEIKEN